MPKGDNMPRLLNVALLTAGLILLPAVADAQTNRPKGPAFAEPSAKPKPKPTQPGSPSMVPMGDEVFRLDSVGLTMMLPLGARAESTTVGSRSTVQITPGGASPSWFMNIQTPVDPEPGRSSSDLLEELMRRLGEAAGMVYRRDGDKRLEDQLLGVNISVVEPKATVQIGSQSGERIYISLPSARPNTPRVVRGYTAFKTTPTQFVSFELVTTESAFKEARGIYETVVATASFENADELRAERAAAITAGVRMFEAITEDDIQALLRATPETWERIYKPSATGADADATELGYVRTRLLVGTPDDLGTTGTVRTMGNRQSGYVVQIDARLLDTGQIIDTRSAFFMAKDRTSEVWTVRTALRAYRQNDPNRPVTGTFSELGARNDTNMVIELDAPGRSKETIKPIMQGDGYISRVEAFLLPALLVRKGIQADFAFYGYDSQASSIRLRRDSLERPDNRAGQWLVRTRLAEDKKPQMAWYSKEGQLLRIELGDGTIREPVSGQRLLQIWKSKGLPVD